MSQRLFKIIRVTKTSQQNMNTDFNNKKTYTGTPAAAAKKGFLDTCKHIGKKIFNKCTLTIYVMEVTKSVINDIVNFDPILDNNQLPKVWKYDIQLDRYDKRQSQGKDVTFKNNSGDNVTITFQYSPRIIPAKLDKDGKRLSRRVYDLSFL